MGCKGCGKKSKKKRKVALKEEHKATAVSEGHNLPQRTDVKIAFMRLEICKHCDQKAFDTDGKPTHQKLFGKLDGKLYCGNPMDPRTSDDPIRFGCGCDVEEKIRWDGAKCPRGEWGPGRNFSSRHITMYPIPTEKRLPGVLDFIGPTHTPEGLTDCTGIGDVMVQSVAAQAVSRAMKEKGIRVRFVTIKYDIPWAKFATTGDVTGIEVCNLEDPDRIPGEYVRHSAPLKAVEIDATSQMNGMCRQEFLAKQFGVDREETKRWDVHIPMEAQEKALQFLAHPIKHKRKIICVSPYTNSSSRQWPLRYWMMLLDALQRDGYAVFVIDRPKGDKGPPHRIQRFPARSFGSNDPELVAAVIQASTLVISNDSGMSHIAGFVGTNALAICGPTDGKIAFGGWPTVRPLQAPGTCTACLWFRDGGWKHWCAWGCQVLDDLKPMLVRKRVLETLEGDVR